MREYKYFEELEVFRKGKHMSKRNMFKRNIGCLVLAVMMLVQGIGVCAEETQDRPRSKPGDFHAYDEGNPSPEVFNVPTQVFGYGGEYYIADAYNQQVLHTDNVFNPPAAWHPVGTELFRPHAIATDGTIFLVVDTDNDRIVTYTKTDTGYQVVETIDNVGVRPHYTVYDAATAQFYVWSSMTGTMYIYKRAAGGMNLVLKRAAVIKDLDGCYTRSFTIDGGTIYFPSMGRGAIYAVNKRNFRVRAVYPVCSDLAGMVQILHVQNYFYLVTSTDAAGDQSKAKIVRAASLLNFEDGSCEDIIGKFGDIDGIPYYITQLDDGHFYTPVIVGNIPPYICRFDIENDEITNVVHMKYAY